MRLVVPFLGKTREHYLDAAIQDYAKRLGRYIKVELPVCKENRSKNDSEETIKLKEAGILSDKVAPYKNFISVALDPRGKQYSSEELAEKLTRWKNMGKDTIVFFIGGHLGLHNTLTSHADAVISLSKMTFTHEMTRVILLEQLYRACTINAGQKYHK